VRRGFTLLETLIGLFLFAAVTGLMLALFFPSMWMFHSASGRNDAQQSVLLLVSRVRNSLLNTALEWVTISQNPPAVSLREAREDAPFEPVSGAAQFSGRFLVFRYEEAARKVLWRHWPPGPPAPGALSQVYDFASPTLSALRVPDLVAICAATHPEERTIANEVDSFSIRDSGSEPGMLTPPLTIKAVVSYVNPGPGARKTEQFELTALVTPRCQRW
jgi:hypothetical protein